MAVKVEEKITVYDHTDTLKVIPWYYKQLRTVMTPPTITPGDMSPSGWTTTEPTVSSSADLAYKIYVAHQNVYGNNTCWWGNVSLSSSYEAAIQAYNEAQAAKTTATNYISANDQGIMVYDGTNGTSYTPSTAPTGVKNVYIDSDSMDVRDGQTVLATFGETSQIGRDNRPHMLFTPNSFRMITDYDLNALSINANTYTKAEHYELYPNGSVSSITATLPSNVAILRESSINVSWQNQTATFTCGNAQTLTVGGIVFVYDGVRTFTATSNTSSSDSMLLDFIRVYVEKQFICGEIISDNITGNNIFIFSPEAEVIIKGDYSGAFGDAKVYADKSFSFNRGQTGSANNVHDGKYLFACNSGRVLGGEGSFSCNNGYSNAVYAFAAGMSTQSYNDYQFVIGRYNDNKSNTVFEIGNGGSGARSNALEVDWDGNVNIANGAKYKINGTALSAADVNAISSTTSQTANRVLASPNGSTGAPTFRALVANDLPTVPINKGGTGQTAVTSPSISISASTGTLVAASVRQWGKVVQLLLRVRNSSAVAAGSDVFTGTISTTALRPVLNARGTGFYGARPIIGSIDSEGAIVVRVHTSQLAASTDVYCGFTYLVS